MTMQKMMQQNLDLDGVSPVCGLQLAHDQMKLAHMVQHQCSETGGESPVLMVLVAGAAGGTGATTASARCPRGTRSEARKFTCHT